MPRNPPLVFSIYSEHSRGGINSAYASVTIFDNFVIEGPTSHGMFSGRLYFHGRGDRRGIPNQRENPIEGSTQH